MQTFKTPLQALKSVNYGGPNTWVEARVTSWGRGEMSPVPKQFVVSDKRREKTALLFSRFCLIWSPITLTALEFVFSKKGKKNAYC